VRTRYSPGVWAGFELLFRPWMRRRLDGVHVRGLEDARWIPELPVLLVANHTSWWDGFLLREVHRRLRPSAPFHVVMTERELRRVPVFRWMGAVPLSDGPLAARSLLRDLRGRIDRRPDAVLGMFPQGRIWPSHGRPPGFRPGAAWLARRLAPLTVVPVGLHLEPLTRPGPAAFVSVGQPRVVRRAIDTTELEVMVALEVDALLAHTREHGEAAASRWPTPSPRPTDVAA
jgi:chlorobactene lauroyltransferase